MMKLRLGVPLALAAGLVLAFAGASAGAKPAASPHTCSGTPMSPGVLKGTYKHGVIVKGACEVNKGLAHVIGTLTVTKNSVLGASFGANGSRLVVKGNLVVDKNGTVFLGCKNTPEDACADDPNPSAPTLSSRGTVSGSLIENSPLGVVAHNGAIGKDVTETGGGGGVSCKPKGFFKIIMAPVFSDYEDSSIGGNLTVSGLKTCWLGLARDKVGGSVTINKNELKDPDGIEILSNKIAKNLSCKGNKHPSGMPPGTKPTWDSAEADGGLYPRVSEPNKVGGKRSGQCVKASPIVLHGPPAAKHF
jgi:hypothetical protein